MTWLDRPSGGFEVFFNRDERRTRLPATPPAARLADDTRFLAPLDGDFGGTWLAANEWGVVLALLNGAAPSGASARSFTSRGLLVTSLAASRSTAEAVDRLSRVDLAQFRPFLLVVLDAAGDRRIASLRSGTLALDPDADLALPVVSSSFDTEEVVRGRRLRFHELLGAAGKGERRAVHLTYHADHAPTAGPRSVCMHRPDAETVSFSRIEVEPRAIRFLYWPVSPCRALGEPSVARLPRGPGSDPGV